MKILVTGGAGYIGSVTAKLLQDKGNEVVVFDNLKGGHKESVSSKLVVGDLLSKEDISKGLNDENFDAVVHFAALALAGESMEQPFRYLQNNILGGLNLLEFMKQKNIKHIVFSSTCAIYGTPKILPVGENAEKSPESVYGESKLAFEKILHWYDEIYGIKHINLRYFNAAGASLDGSLGENHNPETHIIPNLIKSAISGTPFKLFGNDYKTKDGTCIRDYIHVLDLVEAHILAFEKLFNDPGAYAYNVGTGNGYSNKEVVDAVKKISGKNFDVVISPRRPGDADELIADSTKIRQELGFNPKYSDIETIIKTAWQWHIKSF